MYVQKIGRLRIVFLGITQAKMFCVTMFRVWPDIMLKTHSRMVIGERMGDECSGFSCYINNFCEGLDTAGSREYCAMRCHGEY